MGTPLSKKALVVSIRPKLEPSLRRRRVDWGRVEAQPLALELHTVWQQLLALLQSFLRTYTRIHSLYIHHFV